MGGYGLMNAEQEAEMELITVESDLKDAMKNYLKAVHTAEGRPVMQPIDIEKFVFIATAKYKGWSMYHRGNSTGMETHERIGLCEMMSRD